MTDKRSSAEHRMGLVPCPLCKNIPLRRADCKACNQAGMMPVDEAIKLGLSDTEPEMAAVKPENDNDS